MKKINLKYIVSLFAISLFMFLAIGTGDESGSDSNEKKSVSEILSSGDWCTPDCNDPMVAFKFQSSGSFNSTSKLMNIGYREGTWSDKGNNVVKLSYDDGTRTEIKIKSNTKFTIGQTTYKKQ